MAVGPGQDTTQGDAVAVHHAGAFQALLAPVNRRAPRDLTTARGLGDAAVDGDLVQDQPHDPVVSLKRELPQPRKDTQPDPLIAAGADRGGRTRGVGNRLVGTAEPQQLQQLVEDDPVTDTPPVTAQRMSRIVDRPLGQQRRELLPQRLGQPGRQDRHKHPQQSRNVTTP